MKSAQPKLGFIPVTNNLIWICLGLLLMYQPNRAEPAEIVETILPNKLVVTAFYHQGQAARPAILILHGFLQTRNYLTVSSLSNSLANHDYTVLSPTLSLDINRRQRSLPCDAIHTHTMQKDIEEIALWVDWLTKKGHDKIILVGHSYGSLQSIAFVSQSSNSAIKKVITTSLVDVEHVLGKQQVYRQLLAAQDQIKNNVTSLHEYKLSYCKKFLSPANVFISYAEWTKEKILASLDQIKIPVDVILGSNDKRMGENWPKVIKNKGAAVSIIKGANHFFDAEHEFDLLDQVQLSIESN